MRSQRRSWQQPPAPTRRRAAGERAAAGSVRPFGRDRPRSSLGASRSAHGGEPAVERRRHPGAARRHAARAGAAHVAAAVVGGPRRRPSVDGRRPPIAAPPARRAHARPHAPKGDPRVAAARTAGASTSLRLIVAQVRATRCEEYAAERTAIRGMAATRAALKGELVAAAAAHDAAVAEAAAASAAAAAAAAATAAAAAAPPERPMGERCLRRRPRRRRAGAAYSGAPAPRSRSRSGAPALRAAPCSPARRGKRRSARLASLPWLHRGAGVAEEDDHQTAGSVMRRARVRR